MPTKKDSDSCRVSLVLLSLGASSGRAGVWSVASGAGGKDTGRGCCWGGGCPGWRRLQCRRVRILAEAWPSDEKLKKRQKDWPGSRSPCLLSVAAARALGFPAFHPRPGPEQQAGGAQCRLTFSILLSCFFSFPLPPAPHPLLLPLPMHVCSPHSVPEPDPGP